MKGGLAQSLGTGYYWSMAIFPLHIPPEGGTYILLLRLAEPVSRRVGKLGKIDFRSGWYAYVGSAMGPGGLAARVRRHYAMGKKKHWHIDYLRLYTRMEGVFMVISRSVKEHLWADRLGGVPYSGRPVPGFGATDCRCPSHLFHFGRRPDIRAISKGLEAQWIPFGARFKNR